MSKTPPRKRKTAARSLHNICQRLRLPFHKSKAQELRQRRKPTPNTSSRSE